MNTLRVGTDCSGIESPIQALHQLGIPFTHEFSSDIDKHCIKSIKANYSPKRLYGDPDGPYPNGDIRERGVSELPDIDLYVCGFPCQPFSAAGNKKGFDDKRGNVFWACLDVIRTKQPTHFILENVKGVLHHDKKRTWTVIWDNIQTLKEFGYHIDWKIFNTKDYGIPQNRERLFIIGSKNEFNFELFAEIRCKPLSTYVDKSDKNKINIPTYIKKKLNKIDNKTVFINGGLNYNSYPNGEKFCPCIPSSCSSYWCIPQQRYANVKELLRLQGFPSDFKQVVSNTQMKKQIGNSMSVNVLKYILRNMLKL